MSSNDHTQPRFHRGLTFFLALLLSLSVCFTGSDVSLRRALVLEHPARTAHEHFERTIALEQAIADDPEWLRRTVLLFLGRARPALSEAIDVYAEVVELQSRALHEEPSTAQAAPAGDAAPGPGAPAGTVSRAPAKDDPPAPPPPQDGVEGSAHDRPAEGAGAKGGAAKAEPDTATHADGDDAQRSEPGFGCAPNPVAPPPKDSRAELCELLARRAILQGEAERLDDLQLSVARLEGLGETALAHAIRCAYQRLEPRTPPDLGAFDPNRLQPGWARDRLELRLARRTGQAERAAALEHAERAGQDALRRKARTLGWSLVVPVVIGLLGLLAWLVRDRPALPRSSAAVPPAWNFEDGLAVLLRALVFGFALLALVSLVTHELAPDWTPFLATLVAPLPLFVLFHRGLIAPRVLSVVRVLGLDAFPGGAWRWIAVVLGLFAADQLGQALILDLCGRVGLAQHWIEPVPETLLRATPLAFAATCAAGLLWSPFVDEFARRGLLFLTLRARMPALSAALWSAALVAAFQNVSLPSFLMIAWSGFLCAWTFEHTRSILPAMLAQVLAYAGFFGAFSAFYR